MNTKTKKMSIFSVLFGSGIDVEDYENITLPKELVDAKQALKAKENKVNQGFNTTNKGGFAKKIDPKTEEAMRAMHSKVVKKEPKTSDIERD